MPNITPLVTKFNEAEKTCEIEARSVFTGKLHKQILPITRDQFLNWQRGELIQNAMPQLTPDQREFLLTGCTPEEWAAEFGEDDE